MNTILKHATLDTLKAATVANYTANMQSFSCLPQCTFHDDSGFTWLIANGPPGNSIMKTCLPESTIEQDIHTMLTFLKSRTTYGWWQVLPTSSPQTLGAALLAQGLTRKTGRPVMTLDLTETDRTLTSSPQLTIQRVVNAAMLHDWAIASGAGFAMTPEDTHIYFDAYLHHGFADDGPLHHFTGYLDGQAVTSATLLLAGGIAGIYNVSTIPEARRQGYGYTIVSIALQEAAKRDYQYACLQASEESHQLYHRLGFRDLYIEENYEWHFSA